MTEFPKILTLEKIEDRNIVFREALFSLPEELITIDSAEYLVKIYKASKLPEIRKISLKLLYNKNYLFLKDFFLTAYKKERYLDMKLLALRGCAQFLNEREIDKLMTNFTQILSKRLVTTPYNYQEYELLKGRNALPYLVEKYGYDCFIKALDQVNKQYDGMPDAFKRHFTTNEKGDIINLRASEETAKMIDEFFQKQRS